MDLQVFLKDNYSRARRFVRSYVTDPDAAEDIVSEGILAFWRKRDELREETAQAYLFTILRNKALDHLRKERACRMVSLSAEEGQELLDLDLRISSLNETTPDKIFSKEISRIFRETVQSLPEQTREIFETHRFGEKTYAEVARIFDMTDKGVEYHIRKALKALRVALKDYFPVVMLFYI